MALLVLSFSPFNKFGDAGMIFLSGGVGVEVKAGCEEFGRGGGGAGRFSFVRLTELFRWTGDIMVGGNGARRFFLDLPLTDPLPEPVDRIEFTGDFGCCGVMYTFRPVFSGCSSSSSSSSNGFKGANLSLDDAFLTTRMSLGCIEKESSDSNGFNSVG